MPPTNRTALLSITFANLLVAAVLLFEPADFYYGFDRKGYLDRTDSRRKTAMLRNAHYWGIPPIAILTITSGVWFWRISRNTKA